MNLPAVYQWGKQGGKQVIYAVSHIGQTGRRFVYRLFLRIPQVPDEAGGVDRWVHLVSSSFCFWLFFRIRTAVVQAA